jgi:hypothetical protein
MRAATRSLVVAVLLVSSTQPARAQAVDAESKAVIAVADSLLAALSSGD